MKVSELVEALGLKVFTGMSGLENEVKAGCTSDLLSNVMGYAPENAVWVTLQTHKNVIAVATLRDMAAIVIVQGFEPEMDMLKQADEEGIPILGTLEDAFSITGKIYGLISN